VINDWKASIAQADMADWLTVAAYMLAAFMSARAARQAWHRREAGERMFWWFTAVLMVLFGINELLDLQTLLTFIGRAHAKANGWYAVHRSVQYAFVVSLGVVALLACTVTLWLTRRMQSEVRLAIIGLIFIGLFVLLRAAWLNHLDEILGGGAPEFNWGSIQEMAGILIVAAAAALYIRARRSKR
jgi:hypothetical protein